MSKRQLTEEQKKAYAKRTLDGGEPSSKIAKESGHTIQTVYRWQRKYFGMRRQEKPDGRFDVQFYPERQDVMRAEFEAKEATYESPEGILPEDATVDDIFEYIIGDDDEHTRHCLTGLPVLSAEQVERLLDDDGFIVSFGAAEHPCATDGQMHRALERGAGHARHVLKNPSCTSEHVARIADLYSDDRMTMMNVAEHPKIHPAFLGRLLHPNADDDTSVQMRSCACGNPSLTQSQLDRLLSDDDPMLRAAAAAHPNASTHHLAVALNDTDAFVQESAVQNPNVTTDLLDIAIANGTSRTRLLVAAQPQCSRAQLIRLIQDKHPNTRNEAMYALVMREHQAHGVQGVSDD